MHDELKKLHDALRREYTTLDEQYKKQIEELAACLSQKTTNKAEIERLKAELEKTRKEKVDLAAKIETLEAELVDFKEWKESYFKKLADDLDKVIRFQQPVLLLGPRGVGKSSLLNQWHRPFKEAEATQEVRQQNILIDKEKRKTQLPLLEGEEEPLVEASFSVELHVIDIPGEANYMKSGMEEAAKTLERLNGHLADKKLWSPDEAPNQDPNDEHGCVLVMMFEAAKHSSDYDQYYNGLLSSLNNTPDLMKVERIVAVQNKCDQLVIFGDYRLSQHVLDSKFDEQVEKIREKFGVTPNKIRRERAVLMPAGVERASEVDIIGPSVLRYVCAEILIDKVFSERMATDIRKGTYRPVEKTHVEERI